MTDTEQHWAIVELMGHVRMAGRVSEVERFGAKMGRIDIPRGEGFATQFFGGGSVYRISPCTEEVARAVAERSQPQPIHPWEMPRPALPAARVVDAECPGAGFCHGAMKWCDTCGEDVSRYCGHVNDCDVHRHLNDDDDEPVF